MREPASGIALLGSPNPCASRAQRYFPNERQATDYCAVAGRAAQARKGILFPEEPAEGDFLAPMGRGLDGRSQNSWPKIFTNYPKDANFRENPNSPD